MYHTLHSLIIHPTRTSKPLNSCNLQTRRNSGGPTNIWRRVHANRIITVLLCPHHHQDLYNWILFHRSLVRRIWRRRHGFEHLQEDGRKQAVLSGSWRWHAGSKIQDQRERSSRIDGAQYGCLYHIVGFDSKTAKLIGQKSVGKWNRRQQWTRTADSPNG